MDEQRYPVNIQLVGVMHIKRNKLFMTTVLWSDQNEITVYRSLKDFQNLHRQLKKKFPSSNSTKRSERIVPKFKAVRVIKNMQKWNPSKSVLRLKALDVYCTELLKRDARISQSPELLQFLQPNPQDLNSDSRKNSIVIMPSETSLGTSGVKSSAVGITQPFVTEMYRCLATYETKDTKNRPFKVKANEIVDVLIRDKGGWWLVENESKHLAWFPAPYLVRAETDDDAADVIEDESVLYVASRSYKATNSDEISVQIGTVVEVLQKSDNGWWIIRYNQKAGYIPSMYLQPYNNPLIRLMPVQKEKSSSTLDLSKLQAPGVSDRELSKSHGNLSLFSEMNLGPRDKQMSRSLAVLPDTSKSHQTPPSIRVEFAGSGPQGSVDSEEFSFSDDGSSSGSDSLERSRRSYTPTPKSSGNLSPDSATQNKMTASRSDPSLSKMPGTPKVPPRPQAQEILNRCTTVTRKNLVRTG